MTSVAVTELLAPTAMARGLLERNAELLGLVTHAPGDDAALLASARVAAERSLDRASLVAALTTGLHALSAPEEAVAAATRLGRAGVVAVVTGQQPVLLGGPVMVLVKALAAAAVARRLEAAGVAAVPVYWHASEDHDQGEADHIGWPTVGGVERLRVPLPGDHRVLSVVGVPPAEAERVSASVLESLPTGLGHATIERLLSLDAERPSFGAWTGRLLAHVLGKQGIVVVEPDSLRTAAVDVARFELERPGELFAGIERAQGVVRAAGFEAPLALRRPELLFHVERSTGVREPLRIRDGRVRVGGSEAPVAEWLDRLREDPSWVSWNVAARVLAQDVALPVAAQICGPSELGYVSLMREGHAALGVPQPVALLRPGVTLVGRAARRACEKLGVAPVEVVQHGEQAFPAPQLDAAAALADLQSAIEALPAGSSAGSKRRRAELVRQSGLFEEALRREREEADSVRSTRVRAAISGLRPMGRPMERALSFLPWYARGGDAWVGALLDQLGTGEPVHHVLFSEDL